MRRITRRVAVWGALLLPLWSCQNAENQAAKARVFSKPPPDPILEKAKVPVDLARFGSDEAYRLDVLQTTFPEVAARAGAGLFTVKETLTLERGGNTISVNETGEIRFNTKGDMQVQLKTGTTESMELIYANEVLFLKNRGGAWRASRDPKDERHFWADQTHAALRTTTDMLKGTLAARNTGPIEVNGRKGTRFELSLKGEPQDPGVLPETVDAKAAEDVRIPDGGTLHVAAKERRIAAKGAQPQSIDGFIIMDNKTGVPLRVDLTTSLKLPGRKLNEPGVMTIKLETSLTEVGTDTEIKAPETAVEEIVRKRVPVNPLEFMEGSKKAPAKPAPAEPPADEEDE